MRTFARVFIALFLVGCSQVSVSDQQSSGVAAQLVVARAPTPQIRREPLRDPARFFFNGEIDYGSPAPGFTVMRQPPQSGIIYLTPFVLLGDREPRPLIMAQVPLGGREMRVSPIAAGQWMRVTWDDSGPVRAVRLDQFHDHHHHPQSVRPHAPGEEYGVIKDRGGLPRELRGGESSERSYDVRRPGKLEPAVVTSRSTNRATRICLNGQVLDVMELRNVREWREPVASGEAPDVWYERFVEWYDSEGRIIAVYAHSDRSDRGEPLQWHLTIRSTSRNTPTFGGCELQTHSP